MPGAGGYEQRLGNESVLVHVYAAASCWRSWVAVKVALLPLGQGAVQRWVLLPVWTGILPLAAPSSRHWQSLTKQTMRKTCEPWASPCGVYLEVLGQIFSGNKQRSAQGPHVTVAAMLKHLGNWHRRAACRTAAMRVPMPAI